MPYRPLTRSQVWSAPINNMSACDLQKHLDRVIEAIPAEVRDSATVSVTDNAGVAHLTVRYTREMTDAEIAEDRRIRHFVMDQQEKADRAMAAARRA